MHGGHREKGEVSAQFVVLAPVFFSLVFAVVQVMSLWTAAQTASIAARRGARAASTAPGGREMFVSAASAVESTMRELGAHLAAAPHVVAGSRDVTVQVRVGFDSPVPFLPSEVSRSVTVPLEQFVRESDR